MRVRRKGSSNEFTELARTTLTLSRRQGLEHINISSLPNAAGGMASAPIIANQGVPEPQYLARQGDHPHRHVIRNLLILTKVDHRLRLGGA